MPYQHLLYDVADGIGTITLNRPDKLNAVNGEMIDELIAAADEIDADDAVRAVIVTGAGRAFCAGADLSRGAATFDRNARPKEEGPHAGRDGGGRCTLRIYDSKKPWIGAINGPAVGFGMTMQLAFDIRLASDTARFGFVFARRGITPEACSSWFLPRLVGMQTALEWCMTGRVFGAEEARDRGLVRSLHPQGELMDAAMELAREIADNTSAVSVAMTRAMLWRLSATEHPMMAHRVDSRSIYRLGKSEDSKEGVRSFLEKRPPNYPDTVSADMPDFYPWWDEPAYK